MNIKSNTVPELPLDSQGIASSTTSETRPLYWSVRRELWENRAIYVAPLAVAAVYLVGFLISLFWLPRGMRELAAQHSVPEPIELAMPYSHAAMLLMLVGFLVGIFYCLDALHSERRDRSVLLWKSMPVSDFTTVLAKASIPLVVLPVLVFAITVTLQLIMRVLAIAVLLISGAGAATQWSRLPLFDMELVLLYGLIVLVLWHAPVYMWMLLVSGWARRAAFLWAVLPPLALAGVETIAFHTSYFGRLLQDRLFGFAAGAFDLKDKNGIPLDPHFIPLAQLAPERFLRSPSLWLGLVFATMCIAAAVRLRRHQGPL
jgi:ABC-2 type transport system permease protein